MPYIILIWLGTDLYFFQAVETLTNASFILWAYWIIDFFAGAGVLYFGLTNKVRKSPKPTALLMGLMLLSLVPKIAALPVLLFEDVCRIFTHFQHRHLWVSELALVVAAFPFLALLYGMTGGGHKYKVHRLTLTFDDLPDAFDGFTITQLSDIHVGSFTSKKGVEKGINLVNKQKSDLLLFTGDLVNNHASEMNPWISSFAKLEAPFGKFSIFGNHDYGDYTKWKSTADKVANMVRLKEIQKEIGFKLLLNQSVEIKKEGQSIALIGVENWGKGRFHKYGSLVKATAKIPDEQFKILMSHDPSHWEAKTLIHSKHIHLTLAGHTHGMQFGIELFGWQWSPAKYLYPQWAGLYKKNGKYLYVNRGFGFSGFKGRIGIWPEITVITLKKAE
ncbi:MAG TPA: phosphohydrolase [Mucilaginibacter sp.]|nr:phosphohydrolase [Mucilaginibacter sp.]